MLPKVESKGIFLDREISHEHLNCRKCSRDKRLMCIELNQVIRINGKVYEPTSSYLVPMNQRQYRLISGMFEKRLQFKDSLFYDISSWTLPLAFGVEYDELKTMPALGGKINPGKLSPGKRVGGKSRYAYVFRVRWILRTTGDLQVIKS